MLDHLWYPSDWRANNWDPTRKGLCCCLTKRLGFGCHDKNVCSAIYLSQIGIRSHFANMSNCKARGGQLPPFPKSQ